MDRNRPYSGQPHTDEGERGKTLIEGLTMRDVADCIVIGFLEASGSYPEDPTYGDMYKIEDKDTPSPRAIIQNTVCNIEKMMGIFPNIPEPVGTNDTEP